MAQGFILLVCLKPHYCKYIVSKIKHHIGVVGCGNISKAYLSCLADFPTVRVKAVTDIREKVARKQAEAYEVDYKSMDDLLGDPEIDVVLNLTIPSAHVEVGLQALEAGKHVYSEKPLALDVEEGNKLVKRAEELGLRVGCAPDTFLGAGQQTSRHVVESGQIGDVLSGTIFMLQAGPERWHPNPAFFYQYGGGPMMDMGPYYITTLVNLLGPVNAVTGHTKRGFEERVCGAGEYKGMRIPVEIPTHYTGVIEFASGAVITATLSFDVQAHQHRPIELYGSEGSLLVPDPNSFGNEISLKKASEDSWESVSYTHHYSSNSRGIGLLEMLESIENGRKARCSGTLALHVLEVMKAFEKSSASGQRELIECAVDRPSALPQHYQFT